MKLSTRARYALQIMVAVSRNSSGRQPVSLTTVAKQTQISKRYLEKLVIALKKASLLRAVPGRNGGYLLARPAGDVPLGRIIEAGIGPINIVDCVKRPEVCLKADLCECRLVYILINKRITQALNEYSLADVTDNRWREKISQHLLTDEDRGGD